MRPNPQQKFLMENFIACAVHTNPNSSYNPT